MNAPVEEFRNGPTKETTKEVLRRIMRACWNFKKPETREDGEVLVQMWQEALSGNIYKQHVYLDAVTSWLKHAEAGGPPPYPGDILRQCRVVIDEMERDPVKREELYKWREAYRARVS